MRAMAAVVLLGLAGLAEATAQTMRDMTVSRQHGNEQELRARIDFSAGHLQVVPGRTGALYRMTLLYDAERFTPLGEYNPRGKEVTLGLHSIGGTGIRVNSRRQLEQRAVIELPADIPLSLDATLGAVEAEIELGGLYLTDATVKTTASRTVVRFSEPNSTECRLLEVSGSATNLTAYSLGNSRCSDIRFEGGAGDITLDLSGGWVEDATIDVEVALGEVNLQLPPGVGVSLTVDRFLADLDAAGFTRVGDRYITPGFEEAKVHLLIDVSCTVGEVNVGWMSFQ